jgi:hypothetical protein
MNLWKLSGYSGKNTRPAKLAYAKYTRDNHSPDNSALADSLGYKKELPTGERQRWLGAFGWQSSIGGQL